MLDLLFLSLLHLSRASPEPWIANVLGDQLQNSLLNSAPPFADSLRENLPKDWKVPDSVLDGVIGVTADALADFAGWNPPSPNGYSEDRGGCRWFGTAPFCVETCPTDYDFIRESSGRCPDDSGRWCIPDASFGQPCSVFFGLGMTKKFCCKSDPVDCTWSGRWMEAENGYNIYCRYDSSVGRCGQLHCSINHRDRKAVGNSLIEGERCDELEMWDSEGKATCGLIQWTRNGTVLNTWYKTQ
ncbi:unnamed protein product, partial [Mesorhabditis spiculigera]